METLADEIRRLRKAAGLTQVDLATKLGVTQGAIAHLETGRNESVTVKLLFSLSEALGVSSEHFRPYLAYIPEPEPPAPAKKDKPKGKK